MANWLYRMRAIAPIHQTWTADTFLVADAAGEVWSGATDGKGLFLFKDNGLQACKRGHLYTTDSHVKPFLNGTIHDPQPIDIDDLRSFCGKRRVSIECAYCHHTGMDRGRCEICEDDEIQVEDAPGVVLFDRFKFDANVLLKFLPRICQGAAQFGQLHLAGALHLHGRPVVFDGHAQGIPWRSILMNLEWDPERDKDGRHFYYRPGIGALWHLRTGPQRQVLRDWCEQNGHDLDAIENIPF